MDSTYRAGGIVGFGKIEGTLLRRVLPVPQVEGFGGHQDGGTIVFVARAQAVAVTDTDTDGVPDKADKCPGVAGLRNLQGCPDGDGDLFGEGLDDKCPDAYGTLDGCPDRDGDGVPDKDDGCKTEPGTVANGGCPDKPAVPVPTQVATVPTQQPATAPVNTFAAFTETAKGISFTMTAIPGGTYQMGDVLGDKEETDETVHTATVSRFYLGQTEVTQAQYQAVMGTNPSSFKNCDQCPVETVSWDDAQAFIKTLNSLTGKSYRLPTEAEWEYAAREGGKSVRFGNGKNTIDPAEVNFNGGKDYKKPYSVVGEYRAKTTPVKTFAPNALGLYDMSGNVWEWCQDWYGAYPSNSNAGYSGPATGSSRVLRGGSWFSYPRSCRTALRNRNAPGSRNYYFGFRLCLSVQ